VHANSSGSMKNPQRAGKGALGVQVIEEWAEINFGARAPGVAETVAWVGSGGHGCLDCGVR